jgi:esterase
MLRRCFSASPPLPLALHAHAASTASSLGSTVVFLHGLLGSGTNFRTIQMATSRARPTLALDLRNHGRSPHADSGSLDELAGDVVLAIEAHRAHESGGGGGKPGATLVGHSLGGKVAMRVALMRPDLLRSLVVVDIAPASYTSAGNKGWHSVQNVVEAASQLNPRLYPTRALVEAALAEKVPEPGVRSFVAQNLVPVDGGFTWRVNFPALVAALPSYANWPAPPPGYDAARTAALTVDFIGGSLSSYIKPEHQAAIAALFPRAKMHVVEGAGHWVHADRPKEFGELLAGLLAQ